MLRVAKVADFLVRFRLSSLLRFAKMILADIPERQFDDMVSQFLNGMKDAVKKHQLKDADDRLVELLSTAVQNKRLSRSNSDDFLSFVKSKLIYLRNKDNNSTKLDWRKKGVPEEAAKAADDFVSWTKLFQGEYDDFMTKEIKQTIEKYSSQEEGLTTDPDLLQSVFDSLNMTFSKYGEALQKLKNARMLLKAFPTFVSFPAINKNTKERRIHEQKKGIPLEKEAYEKDPFLLLTDKQLAKDFVKFVKNNVRSTSNSKSKDLDDAAEFVVDHIIKSGGLQNFNISSFFRDYQRELKMLGIQKLHQVNILVNKIKEMALDFIEKESPGMLKNIS